MSMLCISTNYLGLYVLIISSNLLISAATLTNNAMLNHYDEKSCYWTYIKCLKSMKDDEGHDPKGIDPYSLHFRNIKLFCSQHQDPVLKCLNMKMNLAHPTIVHALLHCSTSLMQSEFVSGHQLKTIRWAHLAVIYLCTKFNTANPSDAACFWKRLHWCVKAHSKSNCLLACPSTSTIDAETEIITESSPLPNAKSSTLVDQTQTTTTITTKLGEREQEIESAEDQQMNRASVCLCDSLLKMCVIFVSLILYSYIM